MKKTKQQPVRLVINLNCYPLEAIYKAAYSFIDRAYLFLDSHNAKKVEVFLEPKQNLPKKQIGELKGEFLNELLNCSVRINLAARNQKIRELIIGQALVSALDDSSASNLEEHQEDPLGIAVPWEEKYDKPKKKKSSKKKRSK